MQGHPAAETSPGQRSRTCILIAGMHRSGTSAMTRVVNLLGADISENLMPALAGANDRGYWESIAVYSIQQGLLQAIGSSWDDPLPLADGWRESSAARQAKASIGGEIEREFSESELFVVKDPRLARLLPIWLETLDEREIEPVVLIPFRNPLDVAASLAKRDRLPFAKSTLIYLRSNLEAELASRGRMRLFHSYDELLSDWRTFARKLARVLEGRGKTGSIETNAAAITDFLTGELRHHQSSRDELANRAGVPAALIEVYDRMRAAAAGDETSLGPAFDRLRATIQEATALYGGLLAAQAEEHRQADARANEKSAAGNGGLNAGVAELDRQALYQIATSAVRVVAHR